MTFIENESVLKNPAIKTFVLRANRLGIMREIDRWGRVLIHKEFRDRIKLQGEIIVKGGENHLVLRNASSKD